MHIYENHMGGFYTSDCILDYEDIYCEQCGDSDSYLGEAHTIREVLELIPEVYFSAECIKDIVDDMFDIDLIIPSYEDLCHDEFIIKTDKQGKQYPHCTILEDYCCYYDMDTLYADYTDCTDCSQCVYNTVDKIIKMNPSYILDQNID